jgi:methylenetetrahydrofolate dehydrogenase (NADP+)/methenyltetrahydrofolate cyclohydrolase
MVVSFGMENLFDGKKIRDEILKDLANRVVKMKRKPTMAVFLIGDNSVCKQYVLLKQKLAEKTGIQFCLYKFDESDSEEEILSAIEFLNNDVETDGIMMQIPMPEKFNREKLIRKIDPAKDIDGLRFCAGLDSNYRPPVVLAILEAIQRSGIKINDKTKIAQIGHGFLVGSPLERCLLQDYKETNLIIARHNGDDLCEVTKDAEIIVSATGNPGIIKPEMVKEGAVLIDAGTAEENGQLVGDIDHDAYEKASYYTPVPGGIGPVTVAMLFRNLILGR